MSMANENPTNPALADLNTVIAANSCNVKTVLTGHLHQCASPRRAAPSRATSDRG